MTNAHEKILDRFDHLMVLSFCALIYFLPISIALVESFSVLVIFLYLIKKLVKSGFEISEKSALQNISFLNRLEIIGCNLLPKKNILNKPIVLFLGIVLISVIKSQVPALSVKAFVYKILEQCFLYFCFLECMQSKKRIVWFLWAYLVSMVVVSLSGLAQYVYGQDFLRGVQIYDGRVSSSLRHANDFGALIVISYGIFLLLTITKLEKNGNGSIKSVFHETNLILHLKQAAIGVSILLLICLGLTFSRGSWIGFFVSFIFLITRHKKNLIFLTVIFVCFIFIFNPLLVKKRNVSFFSDNVKIQKERVFELIEEKEKSASVEPSIAVIKDKNLENVQQQKKTSSKRSNKWFYSRESFKISFLEMGGMGRKGFWSEAMGIIKDYPFFGAGLNTYSRVVHQYTVNWGGYPHNCYLQMAAEIGIVGVLLFLYIFYVLFRKSFIFLRNSKDIFINTILLGALVGMLGFLIQSFFDTTLYSLQLGNLLWIIMGLIVALQMIPQDKGIAQ